MRFEQSRFNRIATFAASAFLMTAMTFTVGCGAGGGGGYYDDPIGEVEVSNVGPGEVDEFSIGLAGSDTLSWDNGLFDPSLAFNEVEYFGDYWEDFYDAEAYGWDGDYLTVPFFNAYVEAFLINEFEVDNDDGFGVI